MEFLEVRFVFHFESLKPLGAFLTEEHKHPTGLNCSDFWSLLFPCVCSAKLHETVADDFVLDLQVYGRRKAQSTYSLLPPHTLSKFPLFFCAVALAAFLVLLSATSFSSGPDWSGVFSRVSA